MTLATRSMSSKIDRKEQREREAWQQLVKDWEENTNLQQYLVQFYRRDVYGPITGLEPETRLVVLSVNSIVATMYMEAFGWDNVTARNYGVVAEMLSRSINDRDVWSIEHRKLLKKFPKELKEIYTPKYQNGHYLVKLGRAKQLMKYLADTTFRDDMDSLELLEVKKTFTSKG
jgi:hypothetical protein